MSQNNNDNGALMGLALVGAMLAVIGMFIFAALAFVALILTILCVFAWEKPVKLGKLMLEPEEAREFVGRGIAGAVLVPAFALFTAALFGGAVPDDWWFYLVIGGYSLGSVGVAIWQAENEPQGHTPVYRPVVPPQPIAPPVPPQRLQHTPQTQPFRFASWDDEEGRG